MAEKISQVNQEDLQKELPENQPFRTVISQVLAVELPKMDSNKNKRLSTNGGSTASITTEDHSRDYD